MRTKHCSNTMQCMYTEITVEHERTKQSAIHEAYSKYASEFS